MLGLALTLITLVTGHSSSMLMAPEHQPAILKKHKPFLELSSRIATKKPTSSMSVPLRQ